MQGTLDKLNETLRLKTALLYTNCVFASSYGVRQQIGWIKELKQNNDSVPGVLGGFDWLPFYVMQVNFQKLFGSYILG